MKIDNYNGIKSFLEDNLAGKEVSMMVGGYIDPIREYRGKFEGVAYWNKESLEEKNIGEDFNGGIKLRVGDIEINLEAGSRRESDKLDLISFEHDKQTIYYLASEDDRENGTGIFFKKIE